MKKSFFKIVSILMVLMLCLSALPAVAAAEPDNGDGVSAINTDGTAVYLYGDVDFSDKVNIKDATVIQRSVAKLTLLGELAKTLGDVNGDGSVNVRDATLVQKNIARLSDGGFKNGETYTINGSSAWAQTAVFYEIFVRSFYDSDGDGIGDLNGVREKLDYLQELGVNAIWLMPIMDSTTYHGYDVADYYSIDPDYGTTEDLLSLIEECHRRDMNIILDLVVNHTSSSNAWFREALASPDSIYRDYYTISETKGTGSYWHQDAETGLYYYGYYDDIMPDLNYSNPAVHQSVIDVAEYWLRLGVDGYRLDGANNIDRDHNDVTLAWWEEFTAACKATDPTAFLVAENWYTDYNKLKLCYSGTDSSFDFGTESIIEAMALTGASRDIIKRIKDNMASFEQNAATNPIDGRMTINSVMINNHDMDRIATRLQSEDKARLAAALQFTLPGTPFIYYGDELGQKGNSPDDNRRESFDWYAEAAGEGMTVMDSNFFNPGYVFTKPNDGISYEEQSASPDSMLALYKQLIKIRNEHPQMFDAANYTTVGIDTGIYAYVIAESSSDEQLLVVHNQYEDDAKFNLNVSGTNLLTGATTDEGEYVLGGHDTLILSYDGFAPTPTDIPNNGEVVATTEEFTVTINLTVPEYTPYLLQDGVSPDIIRVTGTFNEWNQADTNYELTRTSDTTATITFTLMSQRGSTVKYKFCRNGDWETGREQNLLGKDTIGPLKLQDRQMVLTDSHMVLNDTIEAWLDYDPATGTLRPEYAVTPPTEPPVG